MFDAQGNVQSFGGIQNYILNLTDIFKAQAWDVHIVQPAKTPFVVEAKSYTVYGINTGFYRGNLKKYALTRWVKTRASRDDVIIFATDTYGVAMAKHNTLAIQHGISWDKPRQHKNMLWQLLASLNNQLKYLNYGRKSKALVCVDHNFVNWYRTWFNADDKLFKVIYNFYQEKISPADFAIKWQFNALDAGAKKPLKIIIARRFVDYRGLKMIGPVIQSVLKKHPELEITFAGDGPLKPYLQSLFAAQNNVTFMQYGADESFDCHKNHHIAIIPTLGSEGTSLSMIEAMAAGCMVISTNVGGLSNLVIDGFNGRLTMPDAVELEQALTAAVENMTQTQTFAREGLRSIEHTCSKAHWGQQWVDVINALDVKQK